MRKIKTILAIGFTLLNVGCSSSVPDPEILYQTYLKVCPSVLKITAYDLKYHGKITANSKTYYFLGYSYAWEVNPNNFRGDGKILVFDDKFKFIGLFAVYGDPEVTITGKRMDLYYPRETEQNQRTYYDFSEGIPKTDMNNFGFNYCTKEEILKFRKQ